MSERGFHGEVARLVQPSREIEALARIRSLVESREDEAWALLDALIQHGWRPASATVEAIVRVWVERAAADRVASVLRRVRDARLTTNRYVRALMVETFARVDQTAAAQQVLDEMAWQGDDPGGHLHQVVMAAWARRGAVRRVLALRDRLVASGRPLRPRHRRAVVEALARGGRPHDARAELRRTHDDGRPLDARAYEIVADAYARTGDGPGVELLLEDMAVAQVEVSSVVDEAAVIAWARAGERERARAAFERVAPTAQTAGHWWGLILAAVRAGRTEQAEAVLSEMVEAGFPPEARHYRLLIQAHRRAGQADAVHRLLRDAVAREVALDTYTYEVAADALAAARRPELVREVLAATQAWGPGPSARLHGILIRAELAAGATERAERVLAEMAERGLGTRPEDVDAVADALEREGRAERADALRRVYRRRIEREDGPALES